jgi:hypothetical protein
VNVGGVSEVREDGAEVVVLEVAPTGVALFERCARLRTDKQAIVLECGDDYGLQVWRVPKAQGVGGVIEAAGDDVVSARELAVDTAAGVVPGVAYEMLFHDPQTDEVVGAKSGLAIELPDGPTSWIYNCAHVTYGDTPPDASRCLDFVVSAAGAPREVLATAMRPTIFGEDVPVGSGCVAIALDEVECGDEVVVWDEFGDPARADMLRKHDDAVFAEELRVSGGRVVDEATSACVLAGQPGQCRKRTVAFKDVTREATLVVYDGVARRGGQYARVTCSRWLEGADTSVTCAGLLTASGR